MNDEQKRALHNVIEYMWKDEQRSFDESPDDTHIFNDLVKLQSWLDNEHN